MQNRFWIAMAVFDIILAFITISYVGNQKDSANKFTAIYTRNQQTPWMDTFKACNNSCDCIHHPVIETENVFDTQYLYLLLVYFNIYALICGVGILGYMSEGVNCKQNCVIQFVVGFLIWLCAGWNYQWGSVSVMVLSLFGIVIQSFGYLFFSCSWEQRDDTSFAVHIMLQLMVSIPVFLSIYNFAGERNDVLFVSIQNVLGVILFMNMLVMHLKQAHLPINKCIAILFNLILFWTNYKFTGSIKSSDTLTFLVPFYTLVTLTLDVRFLYASEVLMRFLAVVCLLYEL